MGPADTAVDRPVCTLSAVDGLSGWRISAYFGTHSGTQLGLRRRTIPGHSGRLSTLRQRCAKILYAASARRTDCRWAVRQNTKSQLPRRNHDELGMRARVMALA